MKKIEEYKNLAVGVFIGVLCAAAILWWFAPDGPTPADLDRARADLAEQRLALKRLREQPLYQPLRQNFRSVISNLRACQLDVRPERRDSTSNDTYTGPVNHWDLTVMGDSTAVIACVLALPRDIQAVANSIHVRDHKASISVSVLGRDIDGLKLEGKSHENEK